MATELSVIRFKLEQERRRLVEDLDQLISDGNSDQRQQGISGFCIKDEAAGVRADRKGQGASVIQKMDSLAAVEHALYKIGAGTYGICEDCGRPIHPVRMEVVPHAVHCMECSIAKLHRLYRMQHRGNECN